MILNNIANICGTAVVTIVAEENLGGEVVLDLGLISLSPVSITMGLLTLFVIVFSEIIPKTLGERYCQTIGLLVARPVQLLAWLMTPILYVLTKATAPITRGGKKHSTNEDEIRLLAHLGQTQGVIEKGEYEMIERIFELNDQKAIDLMTPRVAMTCLHGDKTVGEVKDEITASQHSRFVVIGESKDTVLGVAYKAELLGALVDGQQDAPINNFKWEPQFISPHERADQLLLRFQRSRNHMGIVLDEYGGVSGVITLEDVLEVITGEIVDETDTTVDLQKAARERRKRLGKSR